MNLSVLWKQPSKQEFDPSMFSTELKTVKDDMQDLIHQIRVDHAELKALNKLLKFEKAKFSQMLDAVPIIITTFSVPEGRIDYINRYAKKTLGINEETYQMLLGNVTLFDFLKTPEEIQDQKNHMEALLRGESIPPHIHLVDAFDGSGRKEMIVSSTPFVMDEEVIGAIAMSHERGSL